MVPSRLAAVLAVTVLLAACSSAETVDPGPEPAPAPSTVVLVSTDVDASIQALHIGRVGDVRGCLGVDDVVVVWPPGTQVVSTDPLAVRIRGLGVVAVGDTVQLGGGHTDARRRPGGRSVLLDPDGPRIPSACAGDGVFLAGPGQQPATPPTPGR